MSDLELELALSLYARGFAAGASAACQKDTNRQYALADENWTAGYKAGLEASKRAQEFYGKTKR